LTNKKCIILIIIIAYDFYGNIFEKGTFEKSLLGNVVNQGSHISAAIGNIIRYNVGQNSFMKAMTMLPENENYM